MKNQFFSLTIISTFLLFAALSMTSCNQNATNQQTVTPKTETPQKVVKEAQKTPQKRAMTPEMKKRMEEKNAHNAALNKGKDESKPQMETMPREKYDQLSPEDKERFDALMKQGLGKIID